MPGSSPEKRRFQRIPFSASVNISHGDRQWPSELIDVSLSGILLERPDDWPEQEQTDEEAHYRIDMSLTGTDLTITMSDTTIAHMNDGRIGFRCHRIDLDSIVLLKRIMELNLGDAEMVYRELADLGSP